MESMKEKLARLKERRRIASHDNFKQVLEENERLKRPQNWEKRIERNQKKIEQEEEREMIEKSGQDYELAKSLKVQADELERYNRIKAVGKRKQDADFIDYDEETKRQYNKLVKNLKPQEDKTDQGVASTSGSQIDTQEGVERMVESVKRRIEARNKRNRRRRFDDEADVDYINERNMRFNRKLEKHYGDHTEEIKQNFERGTAL